MTGLARNLDDQAVRKSEGWLVTIGFLRRGHRLRILHDEMLMGEQEFDPCGFPRRLFPRYFRPLQPVRSGFP